MLIVELHDQGKRTVYVVFYVSGPVSIRTFNL